MAGESTSSFIAQHRVAVAVTAAVGMGTLAGLYYYNKKQREQMTTHATAKPANEKGALKSKKKKLKKKKKKQVSIDAPSKPAIYPVDEEGNPEITEESVEDLPTETRAKYAAALKERGNEFFKASEYPEAIDYYTKALICKEDPVYYSNRSACYSAIKDDEKTIEDTTKALKINPSYSKCLLRRARAYENLGKYPEAMFDLTALTIYGGMSDTSNESMLERVLKKQTAKVDQEKYSNLPKELPSTSSLSSFFEAFSPEKLELDDSKYPTGSPTQSLVLALQAMKKDSTDEYIKADTLFAKAVAGLEEGKTETSPEIATLIYEYAGAFAFLKADADTALGFLDKAVDLKPRPRTYVIRGLIKADKGDYVGSDAEFNKGIAQNPEDPDIYYQYGQIFYLVGDLVKAQTNFEKAKRLNPDNVYSYIQLACLAYRQGNPALCDKLFKEAKARFPTQAEVPNYYGETLFDRQDFDGALRQFETAARLQEANPTFNIGCLPLVNESAIYQKRGDIGKSIQFLQKACELDPKSEVARLNLGQMYLTQQRVDEAIELFEQSCLLARSAEDRAQAISLMEASKMQLKIRNDPVLNRKVQELVNSMPH